MKTDKKNVPLEAPTHPHPVKVRPGALSRRRSAKESSFFFFGLSCSGGGARRFKWL